MNLIFEFPFLFVVLDFHEVPSKCLIYLFNVLFNLFRRLEPIGNIDLAPTLLAIANVNTPSTMHGRSILELFHGEDKVSPWRQTMLIERGWVFHLFVIKNIYMGFRKMPKLRKIGERVQKQREKYSKFLRIARQCSREKYSAPCKPKQVSFFLYFMYLIV